MPAGFAGAVICERIIKASFAGDKKCCGWVPPSRTRNQVGEDCGERPMRLTGSTAAGATSTRGSRSVGVLRISECGSVLRACR